MKLTLRLVTVLCYLLPFTFFWTTCTGVLDLRFAYNQTEANKNKLLENESFEAVTDTTQNDKLTLADTTKKDIVKQNNLKDTTQISRNTIPNSSDFSERITRKL
ncbi:MAG: hypothetical protein M3N30_10030, partial [Bacteroidota bacterium]|nr:hypothetical protein [Bacteroidota bacterium]